MNKRISALLLSIIMLITSFIGAMPVSAATPKKTTTTAKATTVTKYVVPYENNYAAVRETPSTTEKHPIQIMAFSRGEYCIYVDTISIEKEKDNKKAKEIWYVVKTVWGQSGYVASWAAQVVGEKPTKPSTSTTASTTVKPTTTTTKKQTTTTTAKVTTKVNSSLYYLTSTDVTNIRAGKSTKFAKVGVVKKNEVAVADKLENGWYHIIQKDSKKMDGWCMACYMKSVPSPTTTITTTASKPTTTTTKKASTTKKTTTTTMTKTTTKKLTTTTTAKSDYLYFELGKGQQTVLNGVKVKNTSGKEVKIGFNLKTNTLEIVG